MKREYNNTNQDSYYFAPFTEQRKELRKYWNSTKTDWNEFLYNAETFNNRYKDCYPNQGNAEISLILKNIL